MGITADKTLSNDSPLYEHGAARPEPEGQRLPLPGRLLINSHKALESLFSFTKGCLNGVSLGLLRAETMHRIDGYYFDQCEDRYYDEGYNKSGLHDWERRAIDEHFRGRRRLLVTSVGGGREVLALQELGYVVDGFECNAGLAAFAKALCEKEGRAADIMLAERDQCPATGSVYDGAVVGWGAYTLIQGRKKRVEFLKQLRPQVEEGAPLLVSYMARVCDSKYLRTVAAVGNVFRTILGRERLELGDDLNPIYVHLFNEAEIAAELGEAGFTLKTYAAGPYGHAVAFASPRRPT